MATVPSRSNVLYRNNGDGTFTDVTAKAGSEGQGLGRRRRRLRLTTSDGRLDLLVTNMFGASQLYRNNGDGTFTDVTTGNPRRTSCGAIGSKAFDFNNDGRLDLFIVDMHSDMWLDRTPASIPRTWPHGDLKKKYPITLSGRSSADSRLRRRTEPS